MLTRPSLSPVAEAHGKLERAEAAESEEQYLISVGYFLPFPDPSGAIISFVDPESDSLMVTS